LSYFSLKCDGFTPFCTLSHPAGTVPHPVTGPPDVHILLKTVQKVGKTATNLSLTNEYGEGLTPVNPLWERLFLTQMCFFLTQMCLFHTLRTTVACPEDHGSMPRGPR